MHIYVYTPNMYIHIYIYMIMIIICMIILILRVGVGQVRAQFDMLSARLRPCFINLIKILQPKQPTLRIFHPALSTPRKYL